MKLSLKVNALGILDNIFACRSNKSGSDVNEFKKGHFPKQKRKPFEALSGFIKFLGCKKDVS